MGIDPKTGKPWRASLKNSSLSTYFDHAPFFFNPSEPSNLAQELDNITVLYGSIGEKEPVECEAPLLGTDIFFKQTSK